MSIENPEFWGFEDDENLTCEGIGERLLEYANDWYSIDPFPEEIEVVGYDREEISEKEKKWAAESVLDSLIERWDDEFGGEDYTTHTETMKDAASEFVAKIAAEYHVWRCKPVTRKTVKVRDFLDEDEIPKAESK